MSGRVAASIILFCLCPTLQSSLKSGCVSITDLTSISFPNAQGSPTWVMEREMPLARQVLWWGGGVLEQSCNTNCHQGRVCLLALLFQGGFLQPGKPPSPSGPAAGACMPGTAVRQIRGEVDWLCLENWVAHRESWQCCKFMRRRSNTEGARGGNHLYSDLALHEWDCGSAGEDFGYSATL